MARIRRKRLVSVTQTDIDDGVPNDPHRCTIQVAVQRAFPEARSVKISNGLVHLDMGDADWIYRLPRNATCIPIMIDEGLKADVEPIAFVVDRPMISPKRSSDKPIRVREHQRALPGDGEVVENDNKGIRQSHAQQSAAARMRHALKDHFGKGSRFLGIEV